MSVQHIGPQALKDQFRAAKSPWEEALSMKYVESYNGSCLAQKASERIVMPEVRILDTTKYGKALRLLLSMGGMFRSKPTRTLVIGSVQLQALVDAGLVEPNGKDARGRGKKKAV